jgi:hypothetical protein
MTSPVERISGESNDVLAVNLLNGNTDSLTAQYFGQISSVKPSSRSVLPAMTFAASFASGTPMALLTNGTVRDARGFTSSTKRSRPSRRTARSSGR